MQPTNTHSTTLERMMEMMMMVNWNYVSLFVISYCFYCLCEMSGFLPKNKKKHPIICTTLFGKQQTVYVIWIHWNHTYNFGCRNWVTTLTPISIEATTCIYLIEMWNFVWQIQRNRIKKDYYFFPKQEEEKETYKTLGDLQLVESRLVSDLFPITVLVSQCDWMFIYRAGDFLRVCNFVSGGNCTSFGRWLISFRWLSLLHNFVRYVKAFDLVLG